MINNHRNKMKNRIFEILLAYLREGLPTLLNVGIFSQLKNQTWKNGACVTFADISLYLGLHTMVLLSQQNIL
jgi:hypothetical protein